MELDAKGYYVFPGVVPEGWCRSVIRDILEHTDDGKVIQDRLGGLVEMYHYPSMWNIRQCPIIHDIFTDLFGTEKLWVSIDRVCYKKPLREEPEIFQKAVEEHYPHGFIHWDHNVNEYPRPKVFQGLVALTDTTVDMGGFQCVPDLYQDLDTYIAEQPCGKVLSTSFGIDLEGKAISPVDTRVGGYEYRRWNIEKVPMNTGDLLVFDGYLPHGNGVNRGDKPRFCQYLTMFPEGDDRLREERIQCWEMNSPPSGLAFHGDVRNIEEDNSPADLTKLGKKLLGLVRW